MSFSASPAARLMVSRQYAVAKQLAVELPETERREGNIMCSCLVDACSVADT